YWNPTLLLRNRSKESRQQNYGVALERITPSQPITYFTKHFRATSISGHFTEMVIQADGNASGLDEVSTDEWPSRLDCAQFSYANEPNPIVTANTFWCSFKHYVGT
ncbi:hypothetical protein N9040_06345, partial [Akkermansiaceae bacterium]|nr:hypothetical protein [Akkermansiaceae bacterium]